ncbi:MAG: DUF2156 domain-containing protein, partial [Lachnospiraceae bacterium]|nr:DUF2156 domain-containing protein [Lachnospiraceae bacterium]
PEEPVEEAEPESEEEEETTEQPEEPVEEAEPEPEPEEEVTEQPEEPVEEVEPEPEAEEETTEQPEEPVEEAEPEPEYVEEPRIPVVSREISACVADYGLNFASYMALDRGGKVFTGEYVEGYIPYRIIGKEAIISGGPICRMEDMETLLREYEDMCYEKKISMTFVNVSREQAEKMEEMGFDLIHCGAEPRFALKQYKLKNPAAVRDQREKIRKKYGVSIYEYRYYEKRDEQLEMQMLELNDDWLDSRNGENFTMYKRRQRDAFLPQTMDFSSGDGRRYYYALDEQQKMAAFIVFCPVTSQNGYSCEAGRKRPGMVKNLMELIMHEAFAALKAEGANWASMGLIPDCAGQETCNTRQKRWLEFIYRYYESIYGCRDYREALPKYKPTSWEDMYIVTREYQTIKSQRNQ